MQLTYRVLTALLTTPEALLVGCAILEGYLMITRPRLSWLLPAAAALSSNLIRQYGVLLPSAEPYWSYACTGTAVGAAVGAVMRWFCVPGDSD